MIKIAIFPSYLVMKKSRKNHKILSKAILCRIDTLIEIANLLYDFSPELSSQYIELAFSLVKRYKVKLENRKWLFCRKCFVPWNNKTLSLKEEGNFVVYKCKICNYTRKRHVSKKEEDVKD